MADVDLTPTAEMARNAERGLELRREHGRGGTEVGVARARDISNGKTLSPETVRRMHAFFSRHAKNKAGGEDDAGYIAWMLWGGDEGRDWASRKVDALDRKERNAMSETRKAIMERLGMAAGGKKSAFSSKRTTAGALRRQLKAKGFTDPADWEWHGIERNDPDSTPYLLHDDGSMEKIRASRPGAKATMAAARDVKEAKAAGLRVGDIVRYKDIVDPDDRKWRARIVELRGPRLLVSNDVMPEFREWGLPPSTSVMVDEVVKASRPGAKAKMGRSDEQMISRLEKELQELGYRPSNEPGLAERMNAIRREIKLLKQSVRASRPGAKAKMGAPDPTRVADAFTPAQRAEQGRYLTAMYKLSAKAAVLASDLRNLSDRAQQYAKMLASEGVVTQELGRRMDELLHSFGPYGKIPMSRPGAKVRAALADACWEGYEAVGTKPQDGKTVPNCVPKATAAKPAEDDLEREDVKAGLKLMSASDPAVSDKIRTLIKEGKPQEQAVAIALDMKRRGEL